MRPAIAVLPIVLVSTGACFSVVDVGSYKADLGGAVVTRPAAGSELYKDLRFTLSTMKAHDGHVLEYRVVDGENIVQSRGFVRNMSPEDTIINVPRAIPRASAPGRLDFYVDVNGSGDYDGIGSLVTQDHAWRIDPLQDYPRSAYPSVPGLVQVNFVHNTSFSDIAQYPSGTPNKPKDTGLQARVKVKGLGPYVGKQVQVSIVERATGHTAGLWRDHRLGGPEIDAIFPGCVDMVEYNVDLYVDANGNDRYDDPATGAGDIGFRLTGSATERGLFAAVEIEDASKGTVSVSAP